MAEVFKGKSISMEGFERLVAIKRVLPNLAQNKKFLGMFLDEAKLSLSLNHANVVQVFDLGRSGQTYFIVMEFVEGTNLKKVMEFLAERGRRIAPEEACYIAIEICKGLTHAHQKRDLQGQHLNIVHRDVSPPNILLSSEGEVKITDFGLAKARTQAKLTDPDVVNGQFGYLSPEAAQGEGVNALTDIYACGIVLWEMLAGRRLYLGKTDLETIGMVRKSEIPDLTQINPNVPRELDLVVRKALAKKRVERYQSARDLSRALTAFLFSRGVRVTAYDISNIVSEGSLAPIEAAAKSTDFKGLVHQEIDHIIEFEPQEGLIVVEPVENSGTVSLTEELRAWEGIWDEVDLGDDSLPPSNLLGGDLNLPVPVPATREAANSARPAAPPVEPQELVGPIHEGEETQADELLRGLLEELQTDGVLEGERLEREIRRERELSEAQQAASEEKHRQAALAATGKESERQKRAADRRISVQRAMEEHEADRRVSVQRAPKGGSGVNDWALMQRDMSGEHAAVAVARGWPSRMADALAAPVTALGRLPKAGTAVARRLGRALRSAPRKTHDITRRLRVVSLVTAPRAVPFDVHVDIGRTRAVFPALEADEEVAVAEVVQFEAREAAPQIAIYARSDLFILAPPQPVFVKLDSRPNIRVTFQAQLDARFRSTAGPGRIELDVYYCDERIASATVELALGESEQPEPRKSWSFEEVLPAAVAEKQKTFINELGMDPPDTKRLPTPVAIPYRLMSDAPTPFERAGWIPLVFEAFLRYHLCLSRDVKVATCAGRQTLGWLSNRFEVISGRRYVRRSPTLKRLAYLKTLRGDSFQQIMRSLIDYRNRVWGHPDVFPTSEQCELLSGAYRVKLDVLLAVLTADTGWSLVATNAQAEVALSDPGDSPPESGPNPLQPDMVYLCVDDEWLPLAPLIRWRICEACGDRHFEIVTEVKDDEAHLSVVPGSCRQGNLATLEP